MLASTNESEKINRIFSLGIRGTRLTAKLRLPVASLQGGGEKVVGVEGGLNALG
jgi:hypothetical protein